jgi:hypothetical protein
MQSETVGLDDGIGQLAPGEDAAPQCKMAARYLSQTLGGAFRRENNDDSFRREERANLRYRADKIAVG